VSSKYRANPWGGLAFDLDRSEHQSSISSKIPILKDHLRSKTITSLEQFTEAVIDIGQLDSSGMNRLDIIFFISGLNKTGGEYGSPVSFLKKLLA